MSALSIRNLSPDTHRALRERAAANGRSTEAEIRHILDAAVGRPPGRDIGKLLSEYGRRAGGIDLDITRDPTPAEPASFD